MNTTWKKLLLLFGGGLTVIAAALFVLGGSINSIVNAVTAPPTIKVAVADCRVMAAEMVQINKGFTADQYVIGKIDASLPGATANRGGAFASKPVTDKAELRKQLTSGTAESKAVIADVQSQVKGDNKPTVTEVQNVDNWVPVQYTKVAVVWPDNTTFVGGQEKSAGVLDNGQLGEVSWIFVTKKGCEVAASGKVTDTNDVVKETASKRGACLNGSSHPKPKPKPTPTPTPSGSTCPNGKPIPPNGLCPKDGSLIPAEPTPPGASAPNPIGTAPAPTRPASPDPTPTNGNPVHDVNPPTESAVPDSGSGAGGATANPPTAPSAPAPAPSASPTSSGIVGSD